MKATEFRFGLLKRKLIRLPMFSPPRCCSIQPEDLIIDEEAVAGFDAWSDRFPFSETPTCYVLERSLCDTVSQGQEYHPKFPSKPCNFLWRRQNGQFNKTENVKTGVSFHPLGCHSQWSSILSASLGEVGQAVPRRAGRSRGQVWSTPPPS